ncbi:MAG: hypothetical protein J6R82_07155 [Clostridia bacterium]|nr:hypothetical protein [Clostridia bacterium]
MIHQANWIWISDAPQPEEYAEFHLPFCYHGGKILLQIAAESDYLAELNGQTVGFSQYAGYPFEKYYDTLDLTSLCRRGENLLILTVRYEGLNSACRIDDGAGVIFALTCDEEPIVLSGGETLGGLSRRCLQHQRRHITGQLGYTSSMCTPAEPISLSPCTVQTRSCILTPRPIAKTELLPPVAGKRLPVEGEIYDLGREEAGYLTLTVRADRAAMVKIAYGEHLADGCVRWQIHGRDFSLDFHCLPGENRFTQHFVRIAGRYLQVFAPEGVTVEEIALLPALYPLTERPLPALPEPLDIAIYQTAVRTLRLCMNLHYEDCPWREQALYVLDSRNQMLAGYYAFRETEFARASLSLIGKGVRPDGMLELTYPAIHTPAIPFFSAMYPVAVWEYLEHTDDLSLPREVMSTMEGILSFLQVQIGENGLITNPPAPYWNFYEWSLGSDGAGELGNPASRPARQDLILNCAYIYSVEHFARICKQLGLSCSYDATSVKAAIRTHFWREEEGLFVAGSLQEGIYTQLGNAFALLIGLGDSRTVEALKRDGRLVPATLSMLGYVYDALLAADPCGKDFVRTDIREKWGSMLKRGATSFWETILGEADFGGAGSLCHGWSALPIYYWNIGLE